jgi:RND family efflux transporter MFP subunit
MKALDMSISTLTHSHVKRTRWQWTGIAVCAGVWLAPAVHAASVIETKTLSDIVIYPQHSVSAEVIAQNQARISAQVSGVVKAWQVDVGDVVNKGATLAEIDDTDWKLARDLARAQLTTAQAQLALAERQWKRSQELSAQGFYSPEALQQSETQRRVAQAQVDAAQLQLDQAQRLLDKTKITAPFGGEVTVRSAQQGETVAVGTPLFQIVQLDGRELTASLSLNQVTALQQISNAEWLYSGGKATISLKSARISQSADSKTRLYAMRLPLNPAIAVGPGASGSLQWKDARAHIPANLLVRRDGQLGVFITRNQKAEFHRLPLAQEGQPAASDLPLDSQIVTLGQQSLQHGQSIQP